MNRRDFLRRIGFGALVTAVPVVQAKAEAKKTYRFDELFYQPYEGNKNLYYVKEGTFLSDELYKEFVERPTEGEYTHGIYYPVRDILIEKKDEYTVEDFNGLFNYVRGREYKDYYHFLPFYTPNPGKPSPMRVFLRNNNFMNVEFLQQAK